MTDEALVRETERGPGPEGPSLRRNLSVWEAIGVSVALMAPSLAININPQGTVGLVGRAVPLTFAIATPFLVELLFVEGPLEVYLTFRHEIVRAFTVPYPQITYRSPKSGHPS